MKITIDGGSLNNNNRFGNATFTINLLQALTAFDLSNHYIVYTLDDNFIKPTSSNRISYKTLKPSLAWMKLRVGIEEILHSSDIFLAPNQASPEFGAKKLITFSHGLSFIQYPEYYKSDYARLKKQLDSYIRKSDVIVVSTEKVKADLNGYMGKEDERIKVLPFGIPLDFQSYRPQKREKFFLFVGNNQPIKNVETLVTIFQSLALKDFKLYLVGPFEEYQSDNIQIFPSLDRKEIRELYAKAGAYVSLSFYESFNFPVLEALSQKCRVIGYKSAIIPEMQSYVNIVQNEEELRTALQQVSDDPQTNDINLSKLRKTFSWEKYVAKLQKLYNR